jgi:hypothetical protein
MSMIISPRLQKNLELTISEGWISGSYGQRDTATVLTYHQTSKVPLEFVTLFVTSSRVEQIEEGYLDKLGEQLLSKLKGLLNE